MQAIAIDHVVLRVADLPRSLRFYEDLLGCPVYQRLDDLGMVQVKVGASLIDLVALDGYLGKLGGGSPAKGAYNMDHFCLRIADFDAQRVQGELIHAGFDARINVSVLPSGGEKTSVFSHDPDGNVVELRD